MSKIYDVIILGAGPAGLAAGLYAGRSCLSTLVIEKGKDGGQIAITDEIVLAVFSLFKIRFRLSFRLCLSPGTIFAFSSSSIW